MLDNMEPALMRQAVAMIAGRALVEASGGVNLDNVRQIAECGVDLISIGALTHSAPACDIGMDYG
jgi:nicotinate-nucleotide pyrophosphorylase (carboxylating)